MATRGGGGAGRTQISTPVLHSYRLQKKKSTDLVHPPTPFIIGYCTPGIQYIRLSSDQTTTKTRMKGAESTAKATCKPSVTTLRRANT